MGLRTKLVGVTYDNDDGTNRQDILQRMKEEDCDGMVLDFIHEENNPKDRNAVAVFNDDGEQLGYLNSRLAKEVAPIIDEGHTVYGVVMNITGGTQSKPTFGCNIECPNLKETDESKSDKIADGCFYAIVGAVILVFFLITMWFFYL